MTARALACLFPTKTSMNFSKGPPLSTTTYFVSVNGKTIEAKVKKTGLDYWTGKEVKKLHVLTLNGDDWCYADLAEPVTEDGVTEFLEWMLKPDLKHFRTAMSMFKASGTLLRWQERLLGDEKAVTPTPSTPKAEKAAPAKRKEATAPTPAPTPAPAPAPAAKPSFQRKSLNLF